jgi:D-glycero-D-manno-heptose 1,7-bisphosphate phosphatase
MNDLRDKPLSRSEKALFLDRDGVIVDYIPYLSQPSQVQLPQKAGEALKKWQDAGYLLIVITNQSGIARGYFSMTTVGLIHDRIREEYKRFGVKFQEFLICPHLPSTQCLCRKPSPEMIFQAAKKYAIDIKQSFFIGDALSDIECANHAGCNPILIKTGRGTDTSASLAQNNMVIPTFNNLFETISLI